jgi:aspartokinase
MEKRAINGMKLSPEMSALQLRWTNAGRDIFADLCRLFAEARINLSYCTTTTRAEESRGFCCIDSRDKDKAEELVARDEQLLQSAQWLHPVGILHFYPHHSSLRMLGQTLEALAGRSIGVYAFSSSISSISLVLDYTRLRDAADALSHCFQLPENFSPVIAEQTVRQIMPTG